MSSATANINQTRVSSQYPSNYGVNAKTLSTAPKALGSAVESDSSLTPEEWKAQNQAIWDAIQNGTSDLSPEDEATFTAWWNYNLQQCDSSSWDPSSESSTDASGQPSQELTPSDLPLPDGTALGPMGNVIWADPTADITFNSDPRDQDIWSPDVTLNVPSLAANVTMEKIQDTRADASNPEDVLKITVTDKATGFATVYYVHDYESAKIKLNTPSTTQVPTSSTIDDLTNSGVLTLGQYTEAADGTAEETPPSYTGGDVEHEEGSDHWVHTGKVGEPMEFSPQDTGTKEYHDIYGEANITLRADQTARINYKSGDHSIHYIIVYNREGEEIAVYTVHAGNPVNLNANVNQITEGDEGSDIPIKDFDATGNDLSEFWTSDLTINGDKPSKIADGKGDATSTKDDVPGYLKDFAESFSPDLSDDTIHNLLTDSKYKDLLNEIHYGSSVPSPSMLTFIVAHDDELQYELDPHRDIDMEKATERLAHFLKALGYDVTEVGKDFDDGESASAWGNGDNMLINGKPFELMMNDESDPRHTLYLRDYDKFKAENN